MLGSKAMIGNFAGTEAFRSYVNTDGATWYDVMQSFGLNPGAMEFPLLNPSKVVAMFELHIEQGIVLERQKKKIGIVETIAGMMTFNIVVSGQSNHAGSTPMSMRKDPMVGAGEIIIAIEQIARDEVGPHTVATVGRITAMPGGSNVIPKTVTFSLDVRDVSDENIYKAVEKIKGRAAEISEKRGLTVEFHLIGKSQASPLSDKIVLRLVNQAERMDIPFMRMNSGAVHDAAMVAEKCDVGMIFVPSKDGLSHTPGEFTEYSDIKMGCDLLLNTVIACNSQETIKGELI
jgi:hydantoinase/carbamoylase family amidase